MLILRLCSSFFCSIALLLQSFSPHFLSCLDLLLHVPMTAKHHSQMLHFIHLLYVFTDHHFLFSISFLSQHPLPLVLIQFLLSTEHMHYVLHDTCYVIHIAVMSYHSVATTVDATFVEYHHWNMVFGVPPRQSAVDGTLSMECHSREAHQRRASLIIPTIHKAHLNFLKLHQHYL